MSPPPLHPFSMEDQIKTEPKTVFLPTNLYFTLPHRVLMDSTWTPQLHIDSMWTPCGPIKLPFFKNSTPHGLHMDSSLLVRTG
jgi:hypothetical protein